MRIGTARATWRSGNAEVCKTSMSRFDSDRRLSPAAHTRGPRAHPPADGRAAAPRVAHSLADAAHATENTPA